MARSKPKQQPFDKAFGGRMNAREIAQRNPATPFNPGFTAPAQSGASSTANPIPKTAPKKVNYKGRTITAQPDVSRVATGKTPVPLTVKPKAKTVNKRND